MELVQVRGKTKIVIDEILPGVVHWTAFHEGIGTQVSSYWLSGPRVVIDPMLPPDGLDWLAAQGPPTAILLTNRHHYRASAPIVEAFEIAVSASRPGMHEFSADQRVEPFDFGDQLPGGVIAHEVGAICPDETALEIPAVRAIAIADGVIRSPGLDGPLGFVPDSLMGDDAQEVKRGLCSSYERLLVLDFEHLLLAHGAPVLGEGKQQLRAFLAASR